MRLEPDITKDLWVRLPIIPKPAVFCRDRSRPALRLYFKGKDARTSINSYSAHQSPPRPRILNCDGKLLSRSRRDWAEVDELTEHPASRIDPGTSLPVIYQDK